MDRRRFVNHIKSTGISSQSGGLKILRELGSGGNGVAFLCQSGSGGNVVAKVYMPLDNRDLDETSLKRFRNEIALLSKIRHPNVVAALDAGTISIATYNLPFYVMAEANGTFRNLIKQGTNPDELERILRVFFRACLGVACLHSYGIVHRDLKPENILIGKDGNPWVADLGIAHINPEFATTGVKTMASEKLRNQDYYAPEQRFGSATDIDRRADIYAMGCILYELVSGTPPVRTNAPPLQGISQVFSPLDSIVNRMIAYDREKRYSSMEDALEEMGMRFGWVLAAQKRGRPPTESDIATMIKLIKSSNEATRQQAVEVARRLGSDALDALHDLMGHGRREVRNTAAIALGEITSPASIRYLIAGLYGNTNNPSRYRPTVDTASNAIAKYPLEQRLEAIKLIARPIRPDQVQEILKNIPSSQAYHAALSLIGQGLILLDWAESDLELLAAIDQDQAWPRIKHSVESDTDFQNSFRIERYVRHLTSPRQVEVMGIWLGRGIDDSWAFSPALRIILNLDVDQATRARFLRELRKQAEGHDRTWKDRDKVLKQIALAGGVSSGS